MPGTRACCCSTLLALWLGGACTVSVEPIKFGPECPAPPASAPGIEASTSGAQGTSDLVISDFEDGTTQLNKVGGRTGSWRLGSDFTGTRLVNEPSLDCVVEGYRAGHFQYLGFSSWGANWSADFVAQTGVTPFTYDVRAYTGVSFWAGLGANNPSPMPIRFTIPTIDTAFNSPNCTVCNDHYTKKLTLSRQWVHYTISFDEMKQGGGGVPQTPMKRDQAVGFMIWPADPFDIWIDDVRFYK
jgi:hypothetical protein